ncbi:hypothetical protein KAJ27_08050 [bacterium]|nr:hypothetical protein [bacterium]
MNISKIARKKYAFMKNGSKTVFICLALFLFLGSCLSSIELIDMIGIQINTEFMDKMRGDFDKQLQNENDKLVVLKKNLDMNNKKTHELLFALINDKFLFQKHSIFIAFSITQYSYYNYYLKKKYLSEIITKLPDSAGKNYISLIFSSIALKNGDYASVRKYTTAVKRSLKADSYMKSIAEHFRFLITKKDYSLILKLKSPDIFKYYQLYHLCVTKNRNLIKSIEKFKYAPEFSAVFDMQKLLLDDSGKLNLVLLEKVRKHLNLLDPIYKQQIYDFLKRDGIESLLLNSFFSDKTDFEKRVIAILNTYESRIILATEDVKFLESYLRSTIKGKIPIITADKIFYKTGNIYLKNCLFEKAIKYFLKCQGDLKIPAMKKVSIINTYFSEKKN